MNDTELKHVNGADPSGSVSPLAAMLSSGQHDVAAIERLWQIQQQWEAGEARKSYYDAMANVRAELPAVTRGSVNPHLKNAYASLHDILATISGVLGRHGMSIAWTQTQPDGKVSAVCTITHRLGHSESSTFEVPVEVGRGVNAAQACGSASTYARRYALTALLGIGTASDTDAHVPAAAAAPPPTLALADEDQVQQIVDMLAAVDDLAPGTSDRWHTARGAKYPPGENALGREIPAQHVAHVLAELKNKLIAARDAGDE